MKRITVITAIAALTLTPTALAAPASAQTTREFEGRVVSVDTDARSFRLRDEGRTVTIHVSSRTRYERLSGFGAVRVGRTDIEATVRRSNGRWVALEVERSGRDDRGDDDRGRDHDED